MTDTRPEWMFKEMTEHDFRRIYNHGMITKVVGQMEMTGADTANYWLEAHNIGKKVIRMPDGWKAAYEFVGKSYQPGLFQATYLGSLMRKKVEEIDAWEQKNKRDRDDYERLKAKFGAA